MEKALVEIFVPTIKETYDMFIPLASPMYEVLELVKKAVGDLSGGRFIPTAETAICYRENGAIMNVNMYVFELGVCNGSKLMLI